DDDVQNVNDESDHYEKARAQDQISHYHTDVDCADGLNEEQFHAGPLEYGFGNDGKGVDGAQLQAREGDEGHQGVFQRMGEFDQPFWQATRPREFGEIGAQDL